MLGVKTIGNATLIAFDGAPVLVTDPWLVDEDAAYFGSWALSHEIPVEEKREILRSEHVWFSHGHPDHLNPQSVERFKGRLILLPDHVGGRIKADLQRQGHRVEVLPDRRWVELSPKIRIFCITDYVQDAVLLIDVNGRLFLDLNDCRARGCFRLLKRITSGYDQSYLLKLSGYGDADMINIFDEDGRRREPFDDPPLVGRQLSNYAKAVGASHVIPFSSFHKYQRTDSAWANHYVTPLAAYTEGFDTRTAHFIDPFVFVDCSKTDYVRLNPRATYSEMKRPEDFGDNWSDQLDDDDKAKISDYITRKEMLARSFGYIRFTVGGRSHTVGLNGPAGRGVTFEAPRHSLMEAIRFRVFDDLLIGNFMKTTLHDVHSLYDPNFTYPVAKYADNGGAETSREVKAYLAEYRSRSGSEWLLQDLEERAKRLVRRHARKGTGLYSAAASIYCDLKRVI